MKPSASHARRSPAVAPRRAGVKTAAGIFALLLALLFGADRAAAEPKGGEVHDNWTTKCEKPEDAKEDTKEQCFIFQNLVLKEGGQRVLAVAVVYPPEGSDPVALFTLPLGISLPPGAALAVDDGEPVRFPIERCEPSGCRAGLKLEAALLEKMKKGARAQVTFHDGSRRPISVPLSLKGFTAGLQSLR